MQLLFFRMSDLKTMSNIAGSVKQAGETMYDITESGFSWMNNVLGLRKR